MGVRKFTTMFLLMAAITLTLSPTQTMGLVPYTRTPLWDSILSPPDVDPFRILEHAPLPFTIPKDSDSPLAVARCDWKETPTAHVIKLDVPGLKKEDVKIEVEEENRLVRISGERKAEVEEKEGEKWHRAERVSVKFVRQFRLPVNADLEGIKPKLEDGVLRITVPKVAEEKRKATRVVGIIDEGEGSGGEDLKATGKSEL